MFHLNKTDTSFVPFSPTSKNWFVLWYSIKILFSEKVVIILGIYLHFSLFAKDKENFKIFAKKSKKLWKDKNDNST